MKICGVEISGSEAIFAVAKLKDAEIHHVPLDTKRIALRNDDDSANVKSFAGFVEGFVRDNDIRCIAIKKRGKNRDYAGGPTTFKIEGILQLLRDCEVLLISPQAISAQDRKHQFQLPGTLNKYQHDAYRTACAAIMKAST